MGRKPPAPRGCSLSLGPLLGPSERRESPVCGGGCLEAVPKCVPQDPLLRVYGGSTLEAGDPGGALPSTPLLCDRPLTCESGAAGAGAATGAGLPAAASRRPPWSAHSSSFLGGRVSPDRRLCSRVPLLSAAELLAPDGLPPLFVVGRPGDPSVALHGAAALVGGRGPAVPGESLPDGVLQVSCACSLP